MHIHLEILTCLSQIHVEALIYTDEIPQMHVETQTNTGNILRLTKKDTCTAKAHTYTKKGPRVRAKTHPLHVKTITCTDKTTTYT